MRSDTFKKMVAKAPENELFRFSLGQALFEEESFEESLEHLEFCRQKKPDWMMPRILLGKARIRLGQPAEARLVLNEALSLAVEQHHEAPEAELRGLLGDLQA
jgi:uncharacterized protein HemY